MSQPTIIETKRGDTLTLTLETKLPAVRVVVTMVFRATWRYWGLVSASNTSVYSRYLDYESEEHARSSYALDWIKLINEIREEYISKSLHCCGCCMGTEIVSCNAIKL